ncbi:DoxX family protein [Aquimarina sediminis]|uniref:DoxX family protein n=1 Tax=Aquimarina sediminis TaxID=2070536 RepID=UPI000CA01AFB|nr:hypothetical protein [Aquimarina sediminis]
MKPLIILCAISILSLLSIRMVLGKYDFAFSARIGMSAMLLFTALGHFMFTNGMAMMIPNFVPFKKEIIYFTAIIEILAAIGLHISYIRPLTAWLLILFFLMILPTNIKACIEHINYQKGTYDGNGLMYLWFRIPLQILFIAWVYISSLQSQ